MIGSLYTPGKTLLHRFDPRAKLLLLAQLMVVFFLPLAPGHLAAYLGLIALAAVAAFGLREALRPVVLMWPILALVLLLTPPFHRGGAVLVSVRGFALVTADGLLEALRLIVRFTGISLSLFAYLRCTDPDDLVLALRWFGLPFSLSLVLSVALQYIPYLAALYGQVQEAHRLRRAGVADHAAGRDAGASRGLRGRLGSRLPVLTSVLILSVRRIPLLAMALETRGLGLRRRRSSYRALKGGRALLLDGAILAAIGALLVLSAVLFQ